MIFFSKTIYFNYIRKKLTVTKSIQLKKTPTKLIKLGQLRLPQQTRKLC